MYLNRSSLLTQNEPLLIEPVKELSLGMLRCNSHNANSLLYTSKRRTLTGIRGDVVYLTAGRALERGCSQVRSRLALPLYATTWTLVSVGLKIPKVRELVLQVCDEVGERVDLVLLRLDLACDVVCLHLELGIARGVRTLEVAG